MLSFSDFAMLLIGLSTLIVALHLIDRDLKDVGRVKFDELHMLLSFSLPMGVLGAAPFLAGYYFFLKVV